MSSWRDSEHSINFRTLTEDSTWPMNDLIQQQLPPQEQDNDQTKSHQKHGSANEVSIRFDDFIVNTKQKHFPVCLISSPILCISWLFPFASDVRLTNSSNVAYSFYDDYCVKTEKVSSATDLTALTKYYQFDKHLMKHSQTNSSIQNWDAALEESRALFAKTRRSIFTNNSYHFVASVLNKVHYQRRTNWNQFDIWKLNNFRSSYVSFQAFALQWAPSIGAWILLLLILILIFK